MLPGKFSIRLRDVLRRSSRATSPDGRHKGARMALPSNRVRHHGSTAPPPSVVHAKNHLDEIAHPRLLCAIEQVAPSALRSRFRAVNPRERDRPDGEVPEESQLIGCLSFLD